MAAIGGGLGEPQKDTENDEDDDNAEFHTDEPTQVRTFF
jgi:hypothetical protein